MKLRFFSFSIPSIILIFWLLGLSGLCAAVILHYNQHAIAHATPSAIWLLPGIPLSTKTWQHRRIGIGDHGGRPDPLGGSTEPLNFIYPEVR